MVDVTSWLTQRLHAEEILIAEFVQSRHRTILLEWTRIQTPPTMVQDAAGTSDVKPMCREHLLNGEADNLSHHSFSSDSTVAPERQEVALLPIPLEREEVTSPDGDCINPATDSSPDAKVNTCISEKCRLLQNAMPLHHESAAENLTRLDSCEHFVHSAAFEVCSACAILANTLVMAFELQYRGDTLGRECGFNVKGGLSSSEQVETALMVSEVMFTVCFTAELLVRMVALKTKSFRSGWIFLDSVLVLLALLDVLGWSSVNPSVMRIIRLTRLGRVIKFLRVVRQFDSMFLLVRSIQASWTSFIWSFLVLLTIQIAIGMLLLQMLYSYMADADMDFSQREEVFKYFGTFDNTMLTMFEVTYGNWVPVCRLLVKTVHKRFDVFFIIYRCMFCFAVIRVIAAVFISETNRIVASDEEVTLLRQQREREHLAKHVNHVFASLDESGDGKLSQDEFQHLVGNGMMKEFAERMGISEAEMQELFNFFSCGDGDVSVNEFIDGIARLNAQAKSSEVTCLRALIRRIMTKVDLLVASSATERPQHQSLPHDMPIFGPGQMKSAAAFRVASSNSL